MDRQLAVQVNSDIHCTMVCMILPRCITVSIVKQQVCGKSTMVLSTNKFVASLACVNTQCSPHHKIRDVTLRNMS